MGHDPRGRRHGTPAWRDMRHDDSQQPMLERGKKLVVQMVETFQEGGKPTFVETLDAVEVAKKSGMPLAPIMIYGDDVTHILTEEGIANLLLCRTDAEREYGRPIESSERRALETQAATVSLVLPTLNEEETIGPSLGATSVAKRRP